MYWSVSAQAHFDYKVTKNFLRLWLLLTKLINVLINGMGSRFNTNAGMFSTLAAFHRH